jgi:GTPase SAR1 family protein
MADRFRVLVIGRANAGKTTILQKVCNTTEKPEIFDSEGNKVRMLPGKDPGADGLLIIRSTHQRSRPPPRYEVTFYCRR